jgi:hypothetical protein
MGSGGATPGILNLDTGWKCMAIFMVRLLFLSGRNPLHPLERRVGGSKSRCGHGGGKKYLPPQVIEPPFFCHPAGSLVTSDGHPGSHNNDTDLFFFYCVRVHVIDRILPTALLPCGQLSL